MGAVPTLVTMVDTKISPKDYHLVPVNPDPDFSPKHNQEVIDYTIRRSEEQWRKKQRDFNEKVKERASAIATYAESLKMGRTNSDVKKFFGPMELAYLKGYELMDKLKEEVRINPRGQLMKRVDKFYATTQQKRIT